MTHEIISKGHIRLDVDFNELLSLRNLAKATRHDELCASLDVFCKVVKLENDL